MHIDDERIQRLLHGELPRAEETAVRRHVAECGDCGGRFAQAQRDETEVFALLRHVDHPAPDVDPATIAAEAGPRATPWLRWAAAIALALGMAGAAYAIPGSPLRGWVNQLTHRSPPARQVPDSSVAGIAVAPGLDLVVLFKRPEAIEEIAVLLTDGAEVEVRAITGTAMFSAGTDRLVVDTRDSHASFEVRIPRTAPRVQLVLSHTRIVLKEGSRIVTEPSAHCRTETAVRYVCRLKE
jgi:hypothetical protein